MSSGSTELAIRATVFGLDVLSDTPITFLEGAQAHATDREVNLCGQPPNRGRLELPQPAELVCDEREPSGAVNFQIESHPQAGYLISGPKYGRYLLSRDGKQLRFAPEERPGDEWQRLLIAQVLPFAALLNGLEVFHASAVVRDGEAIAFLGPSHSGKTSIAVELCHEGYDFLADDVLALEALGGELVGHPGTPLVAINHSHATQAQTRGSFGQDPVASNEREQLVRMASAREPAPLRALFFLDRRPDGPPTPCFEPAVGAQTLLAGTFNFVLETPERLRGLLEVCALAAHKQVERAVVASSVGAGELAQAVEARLRSRT
jgi:hypothetical protein